MESSFIWKSVIIFFILAMSVNSEYHITSNSSSVTNKITDNWDFYFGTTGNNFYHVFVKPDTIYLGGLNLMSEDLRPCIDCPSVLKTLEIYNAPNINDSTLIINVLEHQKNIENLVLMRVSISDKTMLSIAKLQKHPSLEWIDISYGGLSKDYCENYNKTKSATSFTLDVYEGAPLLKPKENVTEKK